MTAILNSERVRLIALARQMDGEAARQVNDVLAADPATYPVVITFRVRDPYLELGDTPQSYELSQIVTLSVIEELAPEWWDKEHGAGWYVDAAKSLDGNQDAHGWVKIEGHRDAFSSAQAGDDQLRAELLEVIENFDRNEALLTISKIASMIRA